MEVPRCPTAERAVICRRPARSISSERSDARKQRLGIAAGAQPEVMFGRREMRRRGKRAASVELSRKEDHGGGLAMLRKAGSIMMVSRRRDDWFCLRMFPDTVILF